ncbi:deoxyribonuclease I [Methylophaga sp. SB9B]|nr:deoxyribonuclease I [Methylophaga sp. SB9B]
MLNIYRYIILLIIIIVSGSVWALPTTFEQAKVTAREQIYFDRNDTGSTYCSCQWKWVGRSGGRVDFKSCGYKVRAEGQRNRAQRIEWEHIVPASNFGRARQCWQKGGRSNCKQTDPVFNLMEADLHNLTPTVGELNSDRQNFNYGVLPATSKRHGACDFKVDFKIREVEPRDEIKGFLARVYFYMHDRYSMNMSQQQQRLLMSWHNAHPVSTWELERDRRISFITGHSNPFVTGEKNWKIGQKSTGKIEINADKAPVLQKIIRGNRNSKVFHLPHGCPSYDKVSPKNIVEFVSETEAHDAGYKKAGNCN